MDVCACLVAQSCPTLCDPMDCSLPGSYVHGDSPGKNTGVGCHVWPNEYLSSNPCMGYLENFKLKLNNGCSIWKEDQKKKKKQISS